MLVRLGICETVLHLWFVVDWVGLHGRWSLRPLLWYIMLKASKGNISLSLKSHSWLVIAGTDITAVACEEEM